MPPKTLKVDSLPYSIHTMRIHIVDHGHCCILIVDLVSMIITQPVGLSKKN